MIKSSGKAAYGNTTGMRPEALCSAYIARIVATDPKTEVFTMYSKYDLDHRFCDILGRLADYTQAYFGWDRYALARTSVILGAFAIWMYFAIHLFFDAVSLGRVARDDMFAFTLAFAVYIPVPLILYAHRRVFLDPYFEYIRGVSNISTALGNAHRQFRVVFWALFFVVIMFQMTLGVLFVATYLIALSFARPNASAPQEYLRA